MKKINLINVAKHQHFFWKKYINKDSSKNKNRFIKKQPVSFFNNKIISK